jgi:phage portal protein BeeE
MADRPKQSLIRRIVGALDPTAAQAPEERATGIFPFSWEALAQQLTFTFNGISYPYGYGATTSYNAKQEPPEGTFEGYVQFAYRTNGVIFACMVARMLLFSEARFQFRRMRNGRPGDLFGNQDLRILEEPWPNGTTGDLLARAIQDADLAGNFYARRGRRNTLKRMRPDWVDIILGSDSMPDEPSFADDVEIAGYAYWPGGRGRAEQPILMLREEVCHFAPIPDPCAHFRGMSWLTPVVREIMADSAATQHKQSYFENGATPNLLVKADAALDVTSFQEFVELFKEQHGDLEQAYRFLFMGGGSDATVIGSNMQQMDFKATQGAGETRICMAARVPPVIVGSSEGLESATYSNYGQARRAFADLTMRPLWRNIAGSLAQVVDVPDDAELWYDDRDIPFLQEDVKDAADIVASQAQAIRTLTDGGYQAESVVAAVVANDLRLLEHSGMLPVQVRPPGEGSTNGSGTAGALPIGGDE